MAFVESTSYSRSSAIYGSRHSSLPDALPYSSPRLEKAQKNVSVDQFDLVSGFEGIDTLGALDCLDTLGFALRENWPQLDFTTLGTRASVTGSDPEALKETRDISTGELDIPSRPFRKWMRSLHRRAAHRPSVLRLRHHPTLCPSDLSDSESATLTSRLQRQESSSGSSFGFVAAVRSASASLASVSSVTRSRRNTARSRALSKTDRSSRASASVARMSEDSAAPEKATSRYDAAATERALQRRRVLEEIITTEEGYIRDVRFLINVRLSFLSFDLG